MRICILLMIAFLLAVPVSGAEYTAPQAPDDALELLPTEQTTFAQDLWTVIMGGLRAAESGLYTALKTCSGVVLASILMGLVRSVNQSRWTELAGMLAVSLLLLEPAGSMINLAAETVTELAEYGKLLLGVMAAALASQGGVTTSTALYAGTAVANTLLSNLISNAVIPGVYAYLALAVAASATGEAMAGKLRDAVKNAASLLLRVVLYVFTGYMTVTGVVSGTTDAAALKAAKLTVSGVVPVVGGILSDASEAVIVGAGVVKNAVGIYGLLALIAIWITPFLRIGCQYLLLKAAAALCAVFDCKSITDTVEAFSAAMGLGLAMTGTVCVLLLISVVCFMKGVS